MLFKDLPQKHFQEHWLYQSSVSDELLTGGWKREKWHLHIEILVIGVQAASCKLPVSLLQSSELLDIKRWNWSRAVLFAEVIFS